MTKIISIHSFRGGTGKSSTSANVAVVFAGAGKRVAVIDADIQSPGIHNLFGVEGKAVELSLNDYLWHGRPIHEIALDVTPDGIAGKLFLIPSSTQAGEISRVLREGYDAQKLISGVKQLSDELKLDILIIDTHPGLNEETLISIVISQALLIVMRPDKQDYEGTGIAIKVARHLKVPNMMIVVNKTPSVLSEYEVIKKVEAAYNCRVVIVLPHSDEMMILASEGLFALRFPDHPITAKYKELSHHLMGN
jgi:septum site-determining protein MinD